MNLHALVSSTIGSVNPNTTVVLYQSTGQVNVAGVITPLYAAPELVPAQVQSFAEAELKHMDRMGQNDILKKFYLIAGETPPAGLVRPAARGGDIIHYAGYYWLVEAMPDDFSPAGWVCVRGVMQVKGPDFSASPWWGDPHRNH